MYILRFSSSYVFKPAQLRFTERIRGFSVFWSRYVFLLYFVEPVSKLLS